MKKLKLGVMVVAAVLLVAGCKADDKKETASSTSDKTEETTKESSSEAASGASESVALDVPAGTLAIRQLYTAPHGDKSFGVTTVVMDGDKILAAATDEFQYVAKADFKGVPSSDGGFGENYPADLVLASKLENDDAYSEMMAEKGKATKKYSESMTALMEFAAGKTITELEKELADNETITDVVTGATFADANGYLEAVIDTAKNGFGIAGIKATDGEIELTHTYAAPHGDKSFAVISVAKVDDKIGAAYVDEFQFLDKGDVEGVPNSDGGFGENFKEGTILISKMTNNGAYSKMMAEKGKATQEYAESMNAILDYVTGKTVAEIDEDLTANEDMVDVVTGATFSDTTGYVKAIVEAIK